MKNLALRIAIMENVVIMENVKGVVGFIQNILVRVDKSLHNPLYINCPTTSGGTPIGTRILNGHITIEVAAV